MGYGRDRIGVDQDDILVAGFEAFQFFQRGVEGAAGGVDAVLEPGERLVALLEGIGAPVEVLRAGSRVPYGISSSQKGLPF